MKKPGYIVAGLWFITAYLISCRSSVLDQVDKFVGWFKERNAMGRTIIVNLS
jgi:hypothetical protein